MSADSAKERQRLAKLYASMPLEQLQQIASDAASLTEIAHAALEVELHTRGTSIADFPAEPVTENLDEPSPRLVMVGSFRDVPEAFLAKGTLDSAGIESFLVDENIVQMDWLYSNVVGGVKLLVHEEDVAAAAAVLAEPMPDNFDLDGVSEAEDGDSTH